MQLVATGKLDFNEWMDLATSDPEAFELRRRQMVYALIEGSPHERRHRLRCLQWRIDRVREQSSTPLAGCLSLYEMMWDSLLGEGGLAEALNQAAGHPTAQTPRSADIVQFPPPTPNN